MAGVQPGQTNSSKLGAKLHRELLCRFSLAGNTTGAYGGITTMKRRKTSRDRLGNAAVQESGKAAVYAFRLAPVLVKRIDALAKSAGQTRNQWVRATLRRGVGW